MKKFLLFSVISLLAFHSTIKAQITITQSDAPAVGESWIELTDGRMGIHAIGPAGANQTWDYSTNFVVQDTDYVNFVSPSSLMPPLNMYFPNSNLAFDNSIDSMITYIHVNSSGVYADGSSSYAASFPVDSLDWNPDLLFLPLPFTYNDMRSHTSKFEISTFDTSLNATLKFVSYSLVNFTCDGYRLVTASTNYICKCIKSKKSDTQFRQHIH